ncbi:MAG: formylglycine-generating enzyme family protein [Calditrichaeota bacterium]|nr:formylglycine-generating enzyme family protein [Calditrichota bacterium]
MKRLAGTVAVQVTAAKPSVIASPDRVIASEAKQSPLPEMTFVLIPGGSFLMGSNDGDSDEKPVHRVEVKAFYIMTTEVTQRMWQAIMGDNPSYFKGDDLPVECVSWNDCQEFIKKLNQRDPGKGYRLPSEAEWEYACRAGTTTKYYTGDSESDLARTGWYDGNSGSKTHPVGQKQPNAWGLYDMHGNVWEWCEDWYHDSYNGAPGDGRAWTSPAGTYRVLRGGSWPYFDCACRSASRIWDEPAERNLNYGFRVVRSP